MNMSDCTNKSSQASKIQGMSDLFESRAGKASYAVIHELERHGYRSYLVGGCVRNHLIGLPIVDYDIATSARPDQVKQIFKKTIDTGIRFGTVTVIYDGIHLEVTTFRSEGNYGDTRHPDSIVYEDSIEMDLSRRDFTMNAMACSMDGQLIDPFGGVQDIKQRTIRSVGNPIARMHEDLLRCVRAFRFAAQLGFRIEPATMQAIVACAPDLSKIARERIGVEWRKILNNSICFPLEQMITSGWMRVWDPDFSQDDDTVGWVAFQKVYKTLPDEESRMVCLALLLHKQEQDLKRWMQTLRYSKKWIQTYVRLFRLTNECVKLANEHSLLEKDQIQLTNERQELDLQTYTSGDQTYFCKLRHLLFEYGLDTMLQAQSILSCISDLQYQPIPTEVLRELYRSMPIHAPGDLAINGNDCIKAYGLASGPWIKELITELTEQVLCKELKNEKQALLFAGRKLLIAKKLLVD
jgi:tRNA nucleotidyltransferase (CCA-adding enzyme)